MATRIRSTTQRSRSASRPARKPARRTAAGSRAAPGYHHGDLRRALLEATEVLLTESGLEEFTLREVARRAGVSHGAPAHHFGDVRGLLSAFTVESFARLADSMIKQRETAPADPFEQLLAVGVGYVDFALRNRARFQLMFRSDRLDLADEALQRSGARAYAQLVECIDAISAASGAPATSAMPKIALAWSIVHGFATLTLDDQSFAAAVASGGPSGAINMLRAILTMSRPAFEARGP